MDIDVFSDTELPMVFRVLRTALRPQGHLEPRERQFLDTYATITSYWLPPYDPAPVAPVDLPDVYIEGAHRRKRLVQLAALAVLLNQPVAPESCRFLRLLAGHLGTHDGVIDVIEAVRDGRRLRARVLAMRRGLRVMLKEASAAQGWRGALRFLAALWLKAPVDRARRMDYQRLGLAAEGTLGREYWKHMATNGFGFPGEAGGIPATAAFHDVAHVLTGYDTTPEGEIQQGCFQGGNRREDGFFFIQFVMLQFHQGIQVTPAAPPQTGFFDPQKVLWAIHRGAQCSVDMTHQWDYWPLMAQPLEAARSHCGLLPPLPARPHIRRVA
jgi:hypothetical protein